MHKVFVSILLTSVLFGCTNTNQSEEKTTKIEKLRSENDSLKKIVNEINTKYVFDSISIRDIPFYTNSYKLNSEISGELVFVGYNINDKSQVIKFDSISNTNGRSLVNPDTLKNINGGYQYKKKLIFKATSFGADLKIENDYGKKIDAVYQTTIKAE